MDRGQFNWTPKGIVVTGDPEKFGVREFSFSEPERIDISELDLPAPERGELIGRHAECETLRECLENAKNSTGGIVLTGTPRASCTANADTHGGNVPRG